MFRRLHVILIPAIIHHSLEGLGHIHPRRARQSPPVIGSGVVNHILIAALSEVYCARMKAQETGLYGFWGQHHGKGRLFQVHGSLSLEEKKPRIQALKTSCTRCCQVGHWSDNPFCPKGTKKGKGKESTSSTTST